MRAEYIEMPCLRLTRRQAQRLFGLEETACNSVLAHLVEEGFLIARPDGRYVRAADIARQRYLSLSLGLSSAVIGG